MLFGCTGLFQQENHLEMLHNASAFLQEGLLPSQVLEMLFNKHIAPDHQAVFGLDNMAAGLLLF